MTWDSIFIDQPGVGGDLDMLSSVVGILRSFLSAQICWSVGWKGSALAEPDRFTAYSTAQQPS
jgi:hypothetical protein